VHKFVLGGIASIRYSLPVACTATPPELKSQVADFWNAEPCGSRYLDDLTEFAAHARARYSLEPYIPAFAGFAASHGKRILEIGVGMGADYEQWLKAGAIATGVDLSKSSVDQARRRCELAGLDPDLRVADAEDLPFPDRTFDVVYSYGVMHHSPDTARCLREAWRVLKPGGEARIMLYHHASLTGFMLWLRYGLWRGQSVRQCVYDRLESPGTKTFTTAEVRAMMTNFEDVSIEQVFSPGDLLLHQPSSRFQGPIYRTIWKPFPRTMVRSWGKRWGLFLLINARKRPASLQCL
jgi:ubiquinone/menaquinone biosynthesis C-methylase UbiE